MWLSWLFGRKCERERASFVAEARRAAFLDAVFLVHHANTQVRRWWPDPKPAEITPEEVLGSFDRAAYEAAMEKARKLLRKENPGFAERSYELATCAGITDNR